MEEYINFSFPFSKTLLKWDLTMSTLKSFALFIFFFNFLSMSFLSFTGIGRDFFVCFLPFVL